MNLDEKVKIDAINAEKTWGVSYPLFDKILKDKDLKIGVELGVAYGGHAESILKNTNVSVLFGVDPYKHYNSYNDPMNLSQIEFDNIYNFVLIRLNKYNGRYTHLRNFSSDAIKIIPTNVDFIYIDADHSYRGCWDDLCTWFQKVNTGGIIGGHDYKHPNFVGVTIAIDRFFKGMGYKVNYEGEHVWWIEKKTMKSPAILIYYRILNNYYKITYSIMNYFKCITR